MTIIANKTCKNLNGKIDKSVSDKLEKFITDTKFSKTACHRAAGQWIRICRCSAKSAIMIRGISRAACCIKLTYYIEVERGNN